MQDSVEKQLSLSLNQPVIEDHDRAFLEVLSNHIKGLGFDVCSYNHSTSARDADRAFTTLDYVFSTSNTTEHYEHPANNLYKDCELSICFMLTPNGYRIRDMKLSHSVIEDFTLWCNFDEPDLAASLKAACFFSCEVYEVSLRHQPIAKNLSTIEDVTQAFLWFFGRVLNDYHEQIKLRLKHLTLVQTLEARCYKKSTSVTRSEANRLTSYLDTYSLPENETVVVSTTWQCDYVTNRRNYQSHSYGSIDIDRENFLKLFSTWTAESE
jgi:hypothetical protein